MRIIDVTISSRGLSVVTNRNIYMSIGYIGDFLNASSNVYEVGRYVLQTVNPLIPRLTL